MTPVTDDDTVVTTGVERPAAFSASKGVQPLPGPRPGRDRGKPRAADADPEAERAGSVFSVRERRRPLPRDVEEPAA